MAVYDANSEIAYLFAGKRQVDIYDDYEKLLNSSAVDVVNICTQAAYMQNWRCGH